MRSSENCFDIAMLLVGTDRLLIEADVVDDRALLYLNQKLCVINVRWCMFRAMWEDLIVVGIWVNESDYLM